MSRTGKYSPEFKEQAVKRTLSGSFTIKEVAEKSEEQNPPTDKQLKENEELKKLRKEVHRLREENAILKKYSAMLSKEQNLD